MASSPIPPSGTDPQAPVRDRRRRRATGTLAGIAVLGLAIGMFIVSSFALFTDQEQIPGNSFATGSVDLTATPATALVTASAMVPGDQVTASLNVDNTGSLEHRYSMTSLTTEDTLAAELDLTIKVGVTTCDDANWTADGTVLYTGVLGTTSTALILGDPTPGADTGDRTLAAGADEDLCFNVTLPLSAGNSFAGLSSTATFTFDAEQTANNP